MKVELNSSNIPKCVLGKAARPNRVVQSATRQDDAAAAAASSDAQGSTLITTEQYRAALSEMSLE